ncbi:MAG: hypothetical protein CMH57_02290 [Myxococcales bacterium]|nr:hypothetical protein [Myxococcales bacterium]
MVLKLLSQSPIIRGADADAVQPVPFAASAQGGEGVPAWARRVEASEPQAWQPFDPSPGRPAPQAVAAPEEDEGLQAVAEQLEQAYQEAFAQGMEEGYTEGVSQGRAEGEAQAQEQVEAELEKLRSSCQALEAEVQRLLESRAQLTEQLEEDAVELALLIGERLAAEAQLQDTGWVAPLVREAAGALTEADRVVCAVSPELASRLQEAGASLAGSGVLMEVREGLKPLDVVVESRFGRVDASFSERLEHMRRATEEQLGQPHEPGEQEVA